MICAKDSLGKDSSLIQDKYFKGQSGIPILLKSVRKKRRNHVKQQKRKRRRKNRRRRRRKKQLR